MTVDKGNVRHRVCILRLGSVLFQVGLYISMLLHLNVVCVPNRAAQCAVHTLT